MLHAAKCIGQKVKQSGDWSFISVPDVSMFMVVQVCDIILNIEKTGDGDRTLGLNFPSFRA